MEHYEYTFLLEEAHALWAETLAAEAEGDVFVASETFIPLRGGATAKARIARPRPGADPVLVLVVRGCDKDAAAAEARAFFSKTFAKAGVTPEGDHVFVSSHVPSPLRPRTVEGQGDQNA